MEKHKYVTILAVKNDEACIVDQIEHATAYRVSYSSNGPQNPLSGHYSCMRNQWSKHWSIISKDSWEQKYGKIVYP